MSTNIRIFVRLENCERFQILCFNKTYSFDQLVQEIATKLKVHGLGTLLLVAGAEAAAEVGAVGHIRDGDKCIFVPRKNNTPPEIAAPNRESQHRDQEAAVDLISKDSNSNDDVEEEETPKEGTRFFYKHGGVMYPVLVYKRNAGEGKCYISHNCMKGMAWEGYKRPVLVEVSELVAYTKEREINHKKRMQMIEEKSKKSPENGKKKTGRKQPDSTAKQQKRKRTSDNVEVESSTDEEEEDGEQVNVEDIKVGGRFFILENDISYPVIVNKLPGTKHSKRVIQNETCYIKWIGFRGGMVAKYADLLPYTEARLREYQELQKQAAAARKVERAEKEAAVELASEDSDSSDDDDEEEGTPKAGTRFFYKHGGLMYPVLVYNNKDVRLRNPGKGKCYIRHNGMRGMSWEGYERPISVEVSELMTYTKDREIHYKKRMEMNTEKGKKSPEDDKKKKESKQPASTAKPLKRSIDNVEDESSIDREEEDGDQVNVEDIEVGRRFFILQNNVPYPGTVDKLPGTIHNHKVIKGETCYVRLIGCRFGKIVNYSDLLPDTEARLREYTAFQKQAASAKKAEKAEKHKQYRREKKRKVEQEEEAMKRKKMEEDRRQEEELDRLYGPRTDISGLVELWRENHVEGQVFDDRVKDRFVYFAHDSDTAESIAKWFKVDVEKVVYDNVKFTKALTKTNLLQSFTPIVIPRKWRESTIKNPADVPSSRSLVFEELDQVRGFATYFPF
jgi:hypothetical protein